MEEDIEVIAFACRGTLVDWTGAIEAVVYEQARRNGESPLDRGVALRRRVEALANGHGLACGFERLARERAYSGEESGEECLARVVALARPTHGARELVTLAARSGRRLVAVSRGESPAALHEFGAPFEAVLADLDADALGIAPERVLFVSAAAWRREEARSLGMSAVAPAELAGALSERRTIVAAL
jgi:FMN phosphatase YigB (HAD superfamily)